MLIHYLKLSFRSLRNRKSFTLINITGLAVGMACTILILLWVQDEWNYDRFHKNIDRISRVVGEYDGFRVPATAGPMAAYLEAEIPEIAMATRFKNDRATLQYGDKIIRVEGINAEPEFLDIFSFPEVAGDCRAALDAPGSIVLTETTAQKLFGDADPLGKVVRISDRWESSVGGIVEDVPANSSPPLQFDYLNSFKIYYPWREPDNWNASSDYYTWVLMEENSSLNLVNRKINDLIRRHQWDPRYRVFLQPLTEIHLRANTHRWDGPHGDIRYVMMFSLLAGVILIVACINFMNLSTARSIQRGREVGIRKVLGADRRQLMQQFFGESFLCTIMALPIAYLLVELSLPTFNQIADREIVFQLSEPWILWGSLGLVLFTGILSGLYPALFLSSFRSVKILKSRFAFRGDHPEGDVSFRRIMVVTQFALSIMAIAGTLIIYNQLDFVRNKHLGYEKENLLYVPLSGEYDLETYESVKHDLLQQSQIVSVGGSDQIPTNSDFIPVIKWFDGNEQKSGGYTTFIVDEDFLDTYRIELLEGRFFSKEYATDRDQAVVINEAAAEAMAMQDPVGQELEIYDRQATIIGVVRNFHFETLREQIEPAYMIYEPETRYLNIRIRPGETTSAIAAIEHVVKTHYPATAFEFHFMDSQLDHLYQADQKTGQLFTVFSMLSILISCMGLYALVAFSVENKTKEIGIRKVMGATIAQIVGLLSKDFMELVLLGFLVAVPITWFAMYQWLQDFAYRITIGPGIFLLAGGVAVLIALATVSWQSIRAALANPVESLRSE